MADVAFAISLQDEVSAGARSASASLGQTEGALRRAGVAGGSASTALAQTGAAGRGAASGVRAAGAAGDGAAKGLDRGAKAARDAARSMEQASVAAKRASAQMAAAGAKGGGGFDGLSKVAKGLFPQFGGQIEQSSNLSGGLGVVSAGAAAAALAILAVGAATIAAVAAFLKFGISSADAAQHVRAMAIAQAGSVEAGKALAGTIQQVAGATAMGSEKVAGFARELGEAKLSSSEMRAALEAASGTARVLGDSAGSAFVKSAIEAKKAGKSVTAFAAEAKAKLGPGLAMELSRPSVALDRLGQSIAGLFGDADVSGFGAAINMVSDALAKGSAVGDAFRAIFEALFGGLGGNAQSAGSMVTAVLEEMTIMALQVAIFVKPLARSLSEMWDTMTAGAGPGVAAKVIAYGLAAAFGGVAVVAGVCVAILINVAATIGAMLVVIGAAIGGVIAFGAAVVSGIVGAVQAIPAVFESARAALAGWASSALEAAGNFISGLVSGITGGAGMVIDAIKGLASSALGAFKGILGIASPSRVMLQMGGYTAEGFAGGMDAGAAVVESSASTLAAAPIEAAKAAPPAALPAPRAAGGGGGSVDIGGVTITINGVAGAENILERLPAALADAFEQIAETMGIQPAEA